MKKKQLILAGVSSISLLIANGIVHADDISLPAGSTVPTEVVATSGTEAGSSTDVLAPGGDMSGQVVPGTDTDPGTGTVDPGTDTDPGTGTVDPGTNPDPGTGTVDPGTNPDPGTGTVDPGSNTDPSSGTVDPGSNTDPGSGKVNPGSNTNTGSNSGTGSNTTVPLPDGSEVVDTKGGQLIITQNDGSQKTVTPEEVGGKTNEDGSITVPTASGKMKTLPHTGEQANLLTLYGAILTGIGAFLKKKLVF